MELLDREGGLLQLHLGRSLRGPVDLGRRALRGSQSIARAAR